MKPILHRGRIVGLYQGRDSGVALLGIEDDEKGRVLIPCDGNPACRAFNHSFPGTLRGGVFYNSGIEGERIYYTLNSVGVLEGFTVESDASPELIVEYEKQRSERRKGRVVDRGLLPPDDPIYTTGPIANGRPLFPPQKKGRHIDRGLARPDDRIYSTGPFVAGRSIFEEMKRRMKKGGGT